MRPMPKHFARFAPHIATMNPRAFRSASDALDAMTRSYRSVKDNADTTASGTGGFDFQKDSDGDIELVISADVLWPEGD